MEWKTTLNSKQIYFIYIICIIVFLLFINIRNHSYIGGPSLKNVLSKYILRHPDLFGIRAWSLGGVRFNLYQFVLELESSLTLKHRNWTGMNLIIKENNEVSGRHLFIKKHLLLILLLLTSYKNWMQVFFFLHAGCLYINLVLKFMFF